MPKFNPEVLAELEQLIAAAKGKLPKTLMDSLFALLGEKYPLPLTAPGLVDEAKDLGQGVQSVARRFYPKGQEVSRLDPADVQQEALAALAPLLEKLPQASKLAGKEPTALITNPLRAALEEQTRTVGRTTVSSPYGEELLRSIIRMRRQEEPTDDVAKIVEWLRSKGHKDANPALVQDVLGAKPATFPIDAPGVERAATRAAELEQGASSTRFPDELKAKVHTAFEGLPDRNKTALDLRLGLTEGKEGGSTLDAVAKALGLANPSSADQNIRSSLKKLGSSIGVKPGSGPVADTAEQLLRGLEIERDNLALALKHIDDLRAARGQNAVPVADELRSRNRVLELTKLIDAARRPPTAGVKSSKTGGLKLLDAPSDTGAGVPRVSAQRPSLGLKVVDIPRDPGRQRTGKPGSGMTRSPKTGTLGGPVKRYDPQVYNQTGELRSFFDLAPTENP